MKSPWLERRFENLTETTVRELKIDGKSYFILLAPKHGAWAALTKTEYNKYSNGNLDQALQEFLYFRGLLGEEGSGEVVFHLQTPAMLPTIAVINLTDQCNLHCHYCFASSHSQCSSRMSESVMRSIINQFASLQTSHVTFEFQGGEPLLALDEMKMFISLTEYEFRSRGIDKTWKYRVATNASCISDEFCNLVHKYNIEVSVSIDGPRDVHNLARVRSDGTGSFDECWAGVERLRKAGVNIQGAIVSIGRHNWNRASDLVNFFSHNKLSFKPRPINAFGRELKTSMGCTQDQWFQAFRELYVLSKGQGVSNISVNIYEENAYTPVRDYICLRSPCGAANELLSFNPNGDVHPCDGFKSDESMVIGNVLFEEISAILEKEVVMNLRSISWRDRPGCRDCDLRGMCGQCLYSCKGKFDTFFKPDPQCSSRKKIFWFLIEEWVRLNVARFPLDI